MTGIHDLGAASAVLRNARIEGGAAASFDSLATLLDGARSSVAGELFKVNDELVTQAFQTRARTVPTRLHADSQYLVDPAEFTLGRGGDGIAVTGHGGPPTKLHTKFVVVDGSRGMMMTAAAVGDLRRSNTADFAAHVVGDEAAALQRLVDSAISGDSKAIRGAADQAAQLGIYVNDPVHGVTLLRDRITSQVERATDSVYVASKLLDDPESVRLLADAQRRGLDVLVELSPKSSAADLQRLRDAGLDAAALPKVDRRLHGNMVLTDAGRPNAEAYMGTAMLSLRGMVRPDAVRMAREIGWVTNDPTGLRVAIDNVASLEQSRLGAFVTRHAAPTSPAAT